MNKSLGNPFQDFTHVVFVSLDEDEQKFAVLVSAKSFEEAFESVFHKFDMHFYSVGMCIQNDGRKAIWNRNTWKVEEL